MATVLPLRRTHLPAPRVGLAGRAFVLPLALFLAALFVLRVVLGESLEPDDADLALFGQSLAWGYSEQPPVYAWMVWAAFQLFGTSIVALTVVKTVVLAALYGFLYAAAKRVTGDARLAVLATFSTLLIPTFAWHSSTYLTHTNLLCAVTVATLWQVVRLRQAPSAGQYVLLGVIVGLGVLAKYNYVIGAVAFAGAALMVPAYRRRVLDRRILLTVAAAGLVVLPHFVWLLQNWDFVTGILSHKTGVGGEKSLGAALEGFGNLGLNLVAIPALLLAVFALGFPRALRRADVPGETAEARRLLAWFGAFVLAWLVLQVVPGGATRFHERWLQPFFLLLPVYLFARTRFDALDPLRLRRYVTVLVVAAGAVLVGRTAQVFVGGDDRGVYPLQMRFAEGAGEIRAAAGEVDLVVAADREIGGNLRLCMPQTRCLCAGHPAYVPPATRPEKTCVIVWNDVQGGLPPANLILFLGKLGIDPAAGGGVRTATVPPKLPGRRTNTLRYVTVDLAAARP